ncbi:hypothetical protein [Cronobacter sakazakii]|uniref:hypothetical protein n=1 Tax=Cronobacter sakazakii TaxID=28141 RepID=UPI001375786D|nr:hypothetical protein [Cronobacter sakazakii]NCH76744.1 hypothetical protein [Cronobacter sakazakii]
MTITSTLPPPELPQMVNDGYITETELESDGGIVVNVARYTNAAKNDYLCLYFNGELFSTLSLPDPDTYAWPWSSLIPVSGTAWPADGPHQVWYVATDAAQNTSASPVATAIVDRQHVDGLPPPAFPDADATNTITYASVMQNGGTHVKVPWSTAAYNTGDTVYVYWRAFDANGNAVPASDNSVTHTVATPDVGNGFSVLVSSPFVTAVTTTGSAEAWYTVIPLTGTAQSSQDATVNLDMTGSGIYPAPVIPAGNDGWVSCDDITTDGLEVDIPPCSQFVVGGGVVVYWQGYSTSSVPLPAAAWQSPLHILTLSDISAGFSVTVPVTFITPIGVGSAQAWYSVTAPALAGVSDITRVQVDSQHCLLLPAPVFPAAAGDNTITASEVSADSGTDMVITYPGMVTGDTLTAFWTGYQTTPDAPVPGATWTQTRVLTGTEAQARQAVFHIPADTMTPVGEGYGEGRYQVMYQSGGIASSAPTEVNLTGDNTSSLIMACGTGAPFFDPTVPVRPLNTVTLSGPAGAGIQLSLSSSSNAWFNPSGEQLLTLTLDESGQASAQVYSFSTGNVLVSATGLTNPQLSASASMAFSAWTPGNGDLLSYGISTFAAADGRSTCGVYMQTTEASGATQVRLALTSPTSAILPVSGSTIAYANVSTSHAAGFDVTDIVAETVRFTLSLPDTGIYVTGQLAFSSWPAAACPA